LGFVTSEQNPLAFFFTQTVGNMAIAAFTAVHTVPIRGELSPPALQGGKPHVQQLGHLMGPCSGGHGGIEDLQGLAAIRRHTQSPSSSPQ
jgi:hypothetical protein